MRFFKSNPYLLPLLGILLISCLWAFNGIYHTVLNPSFNVLFARQAGILNYNDITIFEILFYRFFRFPVLNISIAFMFILAEGFLWNYIINKHSMLKHSSLSARQAGYFPLFFFLVLSCCSSSLINFSPELIASLFLMLSVNRLLQSYMKEKALSELFDAGLYLGIALLFYLPCAAFIIFLIAGLISLRTINWNDWIVALIGFSLPFFFAFAYNLFFAYPDGGRLMAAKVSNLFRSGQWAVVSSQWSVSSGQWTWQQILLIILIGLTSLVGLLFFINKIPGNVVKTQKAWKLMLWFGVSAVAAYVLSPLKNATALSLFIIPCSFIYSVYFLNTKARILPDILFFALLAAIIIESL